MVAPQAGLPSSDLRVLNILKRFLHIFTCIISLFTSSLQVSEGDKADGNFTDDQQGSFFPFAHVVSADRANMRKRHLIFDLFICSY